MIWVERAYHTNMPNWWFQKNAGDDISKLMKETLHHLWKTCSINPCSINYVLCVGECPASASFQKCLCFLDQDTHRLERLNKVWYILPCSTQRIIKLQFIPEDKCVHWGIWITNDMPFFEFTLVLCYISGAGRWVFFLHPLFFLRFNYQCLLLLPEKLHLFVILRT